MADEVKTVLFRIKHHPAVESSIKGAERTWASLQQTKAQRGNPSAILSASAQWSSSSEATRHCRRTSGTICESAAKELVSLAAHMPNLPDVS